MIILDAQSNSNAKMRRERARAPARTTRSKISVSVTPRAYNERSTDLQGRRKDWGAGAASAEQIPWATGRHPPSRRTHLGSRHGRHQSLFRRLTGFVLAMATTHDSATSTFAASQPLFWIAAIFAQIFCWSATLSVSCENARLMCDTIRVEDL